jgi:uncharacterized membrane protein YccC
MKISQIERSVIARRTILTPVNAVRTAVAATASLLVARLFRLPEEFWAAITCIIVMQSTLGATLPASAQRLAGAAIGATTGALAATQFGTGLISFGFSILAVGILCWALRIDRSAYRYAGITAAIVMFANPRVSPWTVAFHRFAEVSLGIAVALALTAIWPERPLDSVQK